MVDIHKLLQLNECCLDEIEHTPILILKIKGCEARYLGGKDHSEGRGKSTNDIDEEVAEGNHPPFRY